MNGLLSRLGFSLNKVSQAPEQEIDTPEDPELIALKSKRKALYDKDAEDTGTLYSGWVTAGFLNELCDKHNFMHPHWGSRKVGRLTNLCRNILDIESFQDGRELAPEHTEPVLKLLFWCSLLYPVTVMWVLKVDDVDAHFRPTFSTWLTQGGLNADEQKLVLHAIFNGTSTEPGNIVLDIWHDALKLEEMQFGFAYIQEHMRTTLGKNKVFSAKAKRDCSANLSPHWLLTFQGKLSETRFTSEEITFSADSKTFQDGIS